MHSIFLSYFSWTAQSMKNKTKQIDAFAITKYMNAMNWLLLAG